MGSSPAARAVIVTAHGDRSVLSVASVASPTPGPTQLRVAVAAAGVNFIDVYQRQGIYPIQTPFGLGKEGAGTVVEVGPEVTEFAVGDRVAWAEAQGTHATQGLVEQRHAVPVPDGLALDVAAASMLQGVTAQYLVVSTYPVTAGETVLVHAGAGGVGQWLIQLCKARGARVITTVGSAEKADIVRALGADHIIDYSGLDDLAGAIADAAGPSKVDVAYDGVGRSTFDASLAALRPRGMLVLFGAASGQVEPFNIQRLNSGGSLYLTRPTLGHYTATREELLWRAAEVLGAAAAGTVSVSIGGRYALDDVADAYDDLENRRSTGKLLIVP